jgi:hypothetical protein
MNAVRCHYCSKAATHEEAHLALREFTCGHCKSDQAVLLVFGMPPGPQPIIASSSFTPKPLTSGRVECEICHRGILRFRDEWMHDPNEEGRDDHHAVPKKLEP